MSIAQLKYHTILAGRSAELLLIDDESSKKKCDDPNCLPLRSSTDPVSGSPLCWSL